MQHLTQGHSFTVPNKGLNDPFRIRRHAPCAKCQVPCARQWWNGCTQSFSIETVTWNAQRPKSDSPKLYIFPQVRECFVEKIIQSPKP